MIARIEGTLIRIEGETALLSTDHGLTYELLLPAFVAHRLAAQTHQPITLHTLEFLESQNQGATFIPRLAGFLTAEDKAFYELLVTAKGIGYRRALRAMTLSSARIAAAIADRDIATLQTLPEIGKRTAENLTVNLRDKVERFVAGAQGTAGGAGSLVPGQTDAAAGESTAGESATAGPSRSNSPPTPAPGAGKGDRAEPPRPSDLTREAVEALVQLGEQRSEAMQWVDRVLADDASLTTSEAILTEVYRRKSSPR